MNYLFYRNGIICLLLIVLIRANAQSGTPFRMRPSTSIQNITIDSLFQTSDTLDIFNNTTNIYGLSVDMSVIALSSDFLARIVLADNENHQYLVAESYREISNNDTLTFVDYCEETSLLNGILPTQLYIYINNAKVIIDTISISISSSSIHHSPSMVRAYRDSINILQIQEKVNKINEYNEAHNKYWVAAVTEIGALPFEEKMRILDCPLSICTGGMEYYSGGIFEIGNIHEAPINGTSNYIKEFDWRNRHGKNWMTPVKDQHSFPYCSSFTTNGCAEAMAKLYFNRDIEYDLSDKELASCCDCFNDPDNPQGTTFDKTLEYIKEHGVVMEHDDSLYNNSPQVCVRDQITPSDSLKIGGYDLLTANNEDAIRKYLLDYGPLLAGITVVETDGNRTIKWSHAMVLTGYKIIEEGDNIVDIAPNLYPFYYGKTITENDTTYIGRTCWIFKNSWGTNWNNDGYMYVLFENLQPLYLFKITGPIVTKDYNENSVVCEDADGDGYYFWGIGSRPNTLPSWAPWDSDGDDSDPSVGPIINYERLLDILPDHHSIVNINSSNTSTNVFHGQYIHYHTEIKPGVVFTVNNRLNFYNGSKLKICNGSVLEIVENGFLNNVILEIEPGSKIYLKEGGKIKLASENSFSPPIGTIVEIENGEIY